ncbi:TonB-dependent receptor plug domain-containing protein [Inhella gelatinilytica]|uniref:TonB-dependent receptor n=1 Tax=Inhella gelatinilytica TaxID=2795030 RepID=A0A931NDI4_9BURK|nr:TonB-dependent receptor [Inhella gelatinilytica]MBH9552634.1 TonB-dependent receptor [Inhella gelatinilytica]
MKLTPIAAGLALLGIMSAPLAQTAPKADDKNKDTKKLERVVVTGSSIKRLADQAALPVETLNRSQIEQLGVSSAEGLINLLSANVAGANNPVSTNTVFGADQDRLTGGASHANLRGLGPTGTLVLLNGRRVATHGMSGGSVDLNSIPMDAIERVETLKDGASALYGTDAIGGVINFITRSNFQGLALRGSYSTPEADGGGQRSRLSATGGVGDLDKNGYNLMATLTVDSDKILRGIDRPWATGYQPDMYLTPDSTSSAHANIIASAGTALTSAGTVVGTTDTTKYTNLNLLAIRGQCETLPYTVPLAPNTTIWDKFGYTNANSKYRCTRDYGRMFMLTAPKDATNALLKGTFDLGGHTASLELVASRTEVDGEYAPFQFSTSSNAVTNYPVNGPYYLNLRDLVGAAQFDPTKPIAYRLNMIDWGFRKNTNRTDNLRVQATLEGQIGRFDYDIGLGYGSSESSTLLQQGYADTNKLIALLSSGQYNPFLLPGQTQSATTLKAIEDMQVRGRIFGGETSVKQADAKISGNLGTFMAGDLDFALGLNAREESYAFSGTQTYTCVSSFTPANAALPNSVMGCAGNASSPKLSRAIGAVFGELLVRPLKNLELTLQARHDEYESIGGTTNPKAAFRFTPTQSLMIRGSTNTGFRAPTPQQIKLGQVELQLTGAYRDPVLCADTAAPKDATQCNRSGLPYRQGGNPDLTPETSKQATLGFVFAPTRDFQAFADYWQVKMDDRIRQLSVTNMIQNYDLFKDNFVRDPATGVVQYVQAGWVNAASSETKGIDFGMQYQTEALGSRINWSFGGTKMLSHQERLLKSAPMVEYVGKWTNTNLYLPWRVNASVGVRNGPWASTLSLNYRDDYEDEDRSGYTALTPTKRQIASYTTMNLVGSYSGIKGVTITGSILNLFDRQPPFTWHNVDGVIGAGWDPRVADPRGRVWSLSARWDLR